MKKITGQYFLYFLFALSLNMAFWILEKSEILNNVDAYISDTLYQQPMVVDGNIIIIAIDEKAHAYYGPYQDWNREKVVGAISIVDVLDGRVPPDVWRGVSG